MSDADAAADADVVIVSIPQKNVPDLAPGIVKAAAPGAPVIETNVYGKDFNVADTIAALSKASPERPADFLA